MSEQNEYGRYSMIMEWSDEDNAYIVTVPELSGCRTHGATRTEALKQAQDAIESWVDTAHEDGMAVPPPRIFNYWSPFHGSSEVLLSLSGDDDDEAKLYQERDVQYALKRLREAEGKQQ